MKEEFEAKAARGGVSRRAAYERESELAGVRRLFSSPLYFLLFYIQVFFFIRGTLTQRGGESTRGWGGGGRADTVPGI